MLRDDRHKVVAINEEKSYCEYLATVHNIPIIHGDPCKKHILDNANIKDFDVMNGKDLAGHIIRISDNDGEYIVGCRMLDDNMDIFNFVEENYRGR